MVRLRSILPDRAVASALPCPHCACVRTQLNEVSRLPRSPSSKANGFAVGHLARPLAYRLPIRSRVSETRSAGNAPNESPNCKGNSMTMHFSVHSRLPPDLFLAALTNFSEKRPQLWPHLDPRFYLVHARGDTWAEVTEGSDFAGGIWERARYD